MDYNAILRKEYIQAGKTPVYCDLAKKKIIVPLSYGKDVNRFIDDIFKYEAEADKYTKFNQKCKSEEEQIDSKMLSVGEVKFLPPFDLVKQNYSSRKIVNKSVKRALRYYYSSVKKTVRARKEYANLEFVTSMDAEYIADLEKKHRRYCAKSVLKKVGKTIQFSAEQVAQMTAGAIGIVPVVAYRLLDKKFHFASNRAKTAIDKKVIPYVCKGALKGLIPLSLFGAAKLASNHKKTSAENQNNIEVVVNNKSAESNEVENNSPIIDMNTAFHKKYSITDAESFKELYNDAKNFMALSMFPTEVLVNEAYSDNGKNVNTIGLGSYWYPKNGNPQSTNWMLTSQYVKNNGKLKVNGKQACDLMDGWFRCRENGRVYENMCKWLNGCSLTINEFVAIATVMYNSEKSGREICEFVSENYKYPQKCALKIMQLKAGNEKFNDGITKRHAHEALIYLNIDNYAEKIPYLQIKKGVNSKKQTYYVTSVTQLNVKDCHNMEHGLEQGSLREAQDLANLICKYRCKGGNAVYEIAQKNGLGYLCGQEGACADFEAVYELELSKKMYEAALADYNKKDYAKALAGFQGMIAEGFDGADIHNDMAITYYNMGQYQECISECQQVLRTGEEEMYPAANYNAGKAYEKLGNYQKAYQNYELAVKRAPDEQTYQNAVSRLQTSVSVKNNNTGR